jgi:hypothetical protein
MIRIINREAVKELLDNVYLLLFAMMIGHYFFYTTTFDIVWPQYFYTNLRIFLIVIIVTKAVVEEEIDYISVLLCALTAIVFLIAWKHNDYVILSDAVLLISGCRGISFRKIVKVYLFTCSFLLIITMVFALTGRIENLIYYRNEIRPRISFGIAYPTDFSAHVFYIILAFCYLKKERIKYWEISSIVALGIFVYVFCEARLNTICILLTAGAMTYNKICYVRATKERTTYNMNPILSVILCLSTTLSAMMMIGLTLIYSPRNKLLLFLDKVLSYRLSYGKKGIDIYGNSIFGQQIPLIGGGRSKIWPVNYFFLDSSYLFILLQYGILVLGIILLLFLIMSFRARKVQDWTLLWLIAIMSLQCVVEHHMLDVSYNVLLWGTLAYIGKDVGINHQLKQMLEKRKVI